MQIMISENLNLIDGESLREDRASNAQLLAEQFDPRGSNGSNK
jgi:hypothetical protein